MVKVVSEIRQLINLMFVPPETETLYSCELYALYSSLAVLSVVNMLILLLRVSTQFGMFYRVLPERFNSVLSNTAPSV